jgi:hypothetical protein
LADCRGCPRGLVPPAKSRAQRRGHAVGANDHRLPIDAGPGSMPDFVRASKFQPTQRCTRRGSSRTRIQPAAREKFGGWMKRAGKLELLPVATPTENHRRHFVAIFAAAGAELCLISEKAADAVRNERFHPGDLYFKIKILAREGCSQSRLSYCVRPSPCLTGSASRHVCR